MSRLAVRAPAFSYCCVIVRLVYMYIVCYLARDQKQRSIRVILDFHGLGFRCLPLRVGLGRRLGSFLSDQPGAPSARGPAPHHLRRGLPVAEIPEAALRRGGAPGALSACCEEDFF